MQNNIISKITQVMFSANTSVVKEGLWTLSNLTANGKEYTSAFVHSSAANRVVSLSMHENTNLKLEAAWVLANTITCGSDDDIRALLMIDGGQVINSLLKVLSLKNYSLLVNIIEALTRLVQLGYKIEDLELYFDQLKNCSNDKVFEAAQKLMEVNSEQEGIQDN